MIDLHLAVDSCLGHLLLFCDSVNISKGHLQLHHACTSVSLCASASCRAVSVELVAYLQVAPKQVQQISSVQRTQTERSRAIVVGRTMQLRDMTGVMGGTTFLAEAAAKGEEAGITVPMRPRSKAGM